MKGLLVVAMLVFANVFMTFAWYGQLRFKEQLSGWTLPAIILLSWGVAFFEYCLQIPANRMGFVGNGGPFTLWQLKVIQEVVTLVVFMLFTTLLFKNETLRLNHLIGFIFLVLAVYFIFKE